MRHKRAITPLTPREADVLAHLALGKSNTTIAGDLGISVKTVQNHLNHILAKVVLPERAEPRVYLALWSQRFSNGR